MALNTTQFFIAGFAAEVGQMTNSDGTSITAALCSGTTNGKRVKEVSVCSNSTAPTANTVLVLLLYDGTNSRILATKTIPGGTDTEQAHFYFGSLVLGTGQSLKAQLRTALPSGATLDFSFQSETY